MMSALKIENPGVDVGDCLDGLTIVCSGVFEGISREKLEEFITTHGGRCTGSVSGKTSYLIIGYKLEDNRDVTQGSKYRKAKDLGTPILTESEFEKLIQQKSGKADFTLAKKIPEAVLPTIPKDVVMEESKDVSKQVHESRMWTDKYKPLNPSDLVGNTGAIS
jgi:replication factor C subunit 1